MGSLGHERYFVAGGDWGASIAVRLAYAYPDAVQALHLYMMPLRRPETWPESELASRAALEALERGGGRLRATSRARGRRRSPTGCTDSPVGLMSWIAEKFDRWTDSRGVPPDDVLTTTMIYWVTGCIGSSFWPYWARLHGDWVLDDVAAAGGRIAAPLTFLDFPKELVHVPRVARRARLRRSSAGRRPTTAGTSQRWRRPTCSPTACGASSADIEDLQLARAARRLELDRVRRPVPPTQRLAHRRVDRQLALAGPASGAETSV